MCMNVEGCKDHSIGRYHFLLPSCHCAMPMSMPLTIHGEMAYNKHNFGGLWILCNENTGTKCVVGVVGILWVFQLWKAKNAPLTFLLEPTFQTIADMRLSLVPFVPFLEGSHFFKDIPPPNFWNVHLKSLKRGIIFLFGSFVVKRKILGPRVWRTVIILVEGVQHPRDVIHEKTANHNHKNKKFGLFDWRHYCSIC